MNFSKQRHPIEEIKEIDIVNYLAKLGHYPTKIRNSDYWYLSPLRNEKPPSFKVNRKINRWYDHGLGKGVNIIDFGMLYHGCTLAEFLRKINAGFSFHQPIVSSPSQLEQEHEITILYNLNEKTYYGIGFKNDSRGYEIRNPYFKASSSPKDVNTFHHGAKEVSVFEGFIDFLSFMVINQNKPQIVTDFLVLNSVSFFEKARPFMEQHEAVHLYLDNDSAGQNFSLYTLTLSSKYTDESSLYLDHKNVSDWLMSLGNKQRND